MTDLRKAAEMVAQPQTRVGEMEWQWGYERGWDAAMSQKREWAGLTDEDIDDLWKTEYFNVHYQLPKAVEARLKEKNT